MSTPDIQDCSSFQSNFSNEINIKLEVKTESLDDTSSEHEIEKLVDEERISVEEWNNNSEINALIVKDEEVPHDLKEDSHSTCGVPAEQSQNENNPQTSTWTTSEELCTDEVQNLLVPRPDRIQPIVNSLRETVSIDLDKTIDIPENQIGKDVNNSSSKPQVHLCNICYKLSYSEICVDCKCGPNEPTNSNENDIMKTPVVNENYQKYIQEQSFVCKICYCVYSTQNWLDKHIITKHQTKQEQEQKKYPCPICPFKTERKDYVIVHIRKQHTGERPFTCEICQKSYYTKSHLQAHVKFQHTKEKISCTICSYQCLRKDHMIIHMRSHTGERPFSCDFCGNQFTSKACLYSHVKVKHKRDEKFCCDYCPYVCLNKNYLIAHIRRHLGIKPFKCNICQTSYVSKFGLENHTQFKHTQEKNYFCDICPYKAVQKHSIISHMQRHTGNRTYNKCKLCKCKYLYKCNLTKHMKLMHPQ